MRRSMFVRTALPVLAIVGVSAVAPRTLPAPDDLDAKARAIHQRILAIDSHVDVLLPDAERACDLSLGSLRVFREVDRARRRRPNRRRDRPGAGARHDATGALHHLGDS
jgi:hypothetical protein